MLSFSFELLYSAGTTNSADSTTPAASVGTTSPGPCDDNVEVDCKALNDIVDICSPVTEQTRTMCPRFCGLCGERKDDH